MCREVIIPVTARQNSFEPESLQAFGLKLLVGRRSLEDFAIHRKVSRWPAADEQELLVTNKRRHNPKCLGALVTSQSPQVRTNPSLPFDEIVVGTPHRMGIHALGGCVR